MAFCTDTVSRVWTVVNPPAVPKVEKPTKFGILGAAAIAPSALIQPARSHPEVVIYAVAARNLNKANSYAKKHGIPKVYGGPNGYQELLDDPEVEVIYNPLPNGLHYEWTMKALTAGKHVLLEKPAANTAEETRQMFELAEQKNLILLEAFHYRLHGSRFHPAIQHVKAILDSGELGAIKSLAVTLAVSKGTFSPATDIRFNYDLGGGALMDMGCYTMSCSRYLMCANPTSVLSTTHEVYPPSPKVDRRTVAMLAFPQDVTATITCDLAVPLSLGFVPTLPQISVKVEAEKGTLDMLNFIVPTMYHSISISPRQENAASRKRMVKAYQFTDVGMEDKGDKPWWSTYRYQLEAFVDRVKGRTPQTWIEKDDSIANMEWIERVYEKTGLGSRPRSTFTPP
ncbi:NAD(P)-binding protein [Pluteus cervinus]|uniref:NAD(P)-binding protein n=1 Tax=Pluteus cervinus TaxID=181527 RepID=A0ACD3BAW9_9AGAR|nr:NAD(P)-binding protein [Pluteus cervinus]